MKYLIDSDVLIYYLKGKPEAIARLGQIPAAALYISRINATELIYGAYNSERVKNNLNVIEPFLKQFVTLEFDEGASRIFARGKARLKRTGTLIPDMDLMIAATAITNDCTLITNNLKHFKRIEGLRVEGLQDA